MVQQVGRNPEPIITKDGDLIFFTHGTMIADMTGSITVSGNDGGSIIAQVPSANVPKKGYRILLYSRLTSNMTLANGLRAAIYYTDGSNTQAGCLREVINPRISYDSVSNTIYMCFWTNYKALPPGDEYSASSQYLWAIDETDENFDWDQKVYRALCYTIGSLQYGYIDGGFAEGKPITKDIQNVGYDIIPIFKKPKIAQWRTISASETEQAGDPILDLVGAGSSSLISLETQINDRKDSPTVYGVVGDVIDIERTAYPPPDPPGPEDPKPEREEMKAYIAGTIETDDHPEPDIPGAKILEIYDNQVFKGRNVVQLLLGIAQQQCDIDESVQFDTGDATGMLSATNVGNNPILKDERALLGNTVEGTWYAYGCPEGIGDDLELELGTVVYRDITGGVKSTERGELRDVFAIEQTGDSDDKNALRIDADDGDINKPYSGARFLEADDGNDGGFWSERKVIFFLGVYKAGDSNILEPDGQGSFWIIQYLTKTKQGGWTTEKEINHVTNISDRNIYGIGALGLNEDATVCILHTDGKGNWGACPLTNTDIYPSTKYVESDTAIANVGGLWHNGLEKNESTLPNQPEEVYQIKTQGASSLVEKWTGGELKRSGQQDGTFNKRKLLQFLTGKVTQEGGITASGTGSVQLVNKTGSVTDPAAIIFNVTNITESPISQDALVIISSDNNGEWYCLPAAGTNIKRATIIDAKILPEESGNVQPLTYVGDTWIDDGEPVEAENVGYYALYEDDNTILYQNAGHYFVYGDAYYTVGRVTQSSGSGETASSGIKPTESGTVELGTINETGEFEPYNAIADNTITAFNLGSQKALKDMIVNIHLDYTGQYWFINDIETPAIAAETRTGAAGPPIPKTKATYIKAGGTASEYTATEYILTHNGKIIPKDAKVEIKYDEDGTPYTQPIGKITYVARVVSNYITPNTEGDIKIVKMGESDWEDVEGGNVRARNLGPSRAIKDALVHVTEDEYSLPFFRFNRHHVVAWRIEFVCGPSFGNWTVKVYRKSGHMIRPPYWLDTNDPAIPVVIDHDWETPKNNYGEVVYWNDDVGLRNDEVGKEPIAPVWELVGSGITNNFDWDYTFKVVTLFTKGEEGNPDKYKEEYYINDDHFFEKEWTLEDYSFPMVTNMVAIDGTYEIEVTHVPPSVVKNYFTCLSQSSETLGELVGPIYDEYDSEIWYYTMTGHEEQASWGSGGDVRMFFIDSTEGNIADNIHQAEYLNTWNRSDKLGNNVTQAIYTGEYYRDSLWTSDQNWTPGTPPQYVGDESAGGSWNIPSSFTHRPGTGYGVEDFDPDNDFEKPTYTPAP